MKNITEPPHEDLATSAHDTGRTILLLHTHGARHGDAMAWATALARSLLAEVVVVQLIPENAWGAHVLFPQLSTLDSVVKLRETRAAQRVTQRWARWRRQRGQTCRHREIRRIAELREVCTHENVLFVVVAGSWRGEAAVQLMRSACSPVLVARPPLRTGRILVATNLLDQRYPVIADAVPIARALGSQITLAHNVAPYVSSLREFFMSDDEVLYGSRRLQLEDANARLCARATIALTDHFDPAMGICQAAWCHSAGLIVVGAPRSRHIMSDATSSQVVDKSDRSVLMLPAA